VIEADSDRRTIIAGSWLQRAVIGMVVITASLSNKLAINVGSWLEQAVIAVLHKKS
jgi:hypothetical protein